MGQYVLAGFEESEQFRSLHLFKIPTSNNQVIYLYSLLALGVVSSETNFSICGARVLGVEHQQLLISTQSTRGSLKLSQKTNGETKTVRLTTSMKNSELRNQLEDLITNCLPYFHIGFSLENFIQVISHFFEKYNNTCLILQYFKKPSDNTGVCCRQVCSYFYLDPSGDYVTSRQM